MTMNEEEQMTFDFMEIDRSQSFDGYQDFAETTAIYPEDKALEYLALGLTSEAGEVAGKVKKLIRDGEMSVEDLAKELGDVVWYVSQLCTELDLYFSDVMGLNVGKLSDRLQRGVIGGNGDSR